MYHSDPFNSPSHYTHCKIEPLDFITANKLDFLEGNIVKYVSRYKRKDGVNDLKKARVYLDRLIERETEEAQRERPPF